VVAIVVVVLGLFPVLVAVLLPVVLLSVAVGWYYQKCSQEMKRLDSTTRSPIYHEFAVHRRCCCCCGCACAEKGW